MDLRATACYLGAAHSAQQSNRLDSIFSRLRFGSYITSRHHVEISKDWNIPRRRGRQSQTSWARFYRRNQMQCQSTRYLQGVRCYHDRNIQQSSFNVGDMVLRRTQDETGLHKLNSRWEGPFIVTKVTRPGSYQLVDSEGQEVPNSWNIEHLRRFYLWQSVSAKVPAYIC